MSMPWLLLSATAVGTRRVTSGLPSVSTGPQRRESLALMIDYLTRLTPGLRGGRIGSGDRKEDPLWPG